MSNKKRSCGILIKCGKRYLLVHATKDWVPQLINDGYWGVPKGQPEAGESDQTTALRELKEETGIDLFNRRSKLELIAEYESTKKSFVVFLYVDKNQELMNHLFNCESTFLNNGVETKEIDRFHWFTKNELEEIISDNHKNRLFPQKKRKRKNE